MYQQIMNSDYLFPNLLYSRVFHQKFGMGNVVHVDGDKLEIAFDRAGYKKVVAGFVSKPCDADDGVFPGTAAT